MSYGLGLRAGGYLSNHHAVPRCVQIPVRQYGVRLIDKRFLDYCDRLGWPVHVWTVNDPDEMVRLLDMGVSGLMTDQAQRLKALLEHRGNGPEPSLSRRDLSVGGSILQARFFLV